MGIFSFLKKKPEGKIPTPPSPPGAIPKPSIPKSIASTAAGSVPKPTPKLLFPSSKHPMQSSDSSKPLFPSVPEDDEIMAPRQIDDFGIPEKENFELPDIDIPKFKFPNLSEKTEIKHAIKETTDIPEPKMPSPIMPSPEIKNIPEKLPDLDLKSQKIQSLKMPKVKSEQKLPESIEKPIDLKPLPKHKRPVFVKGDRFLAIRKVIMDMKDNIKNIETVFADLTEINNKQEADIDEWHSSVEAIQRKLVYIDKTLFEG